jgi:hypothetical protein
MGDSTTLTLFASKVPGEAFPTNQGDQQPPPVSDLRRITYWMADSSGGGLCRQEVRVVTSQDALNSGVPSGDPATYRLSSAVRSLQFRYFDGTNWQDSWDSTVLGDDGVTPVGSPRAIEITIGIQPRRPSGSTKDPEVKSYQHVVAIATATGSTEQASTGVTPQIATGAGTAP